MKAGTPGSAFRKLARGVALAVLLAACPRAYSDLESAAAAIERGEYDTAFAELKPLAHAGDIRAQDALATMYLRGLGVDRDVRAAMSWYCMVAHHAEGGRGIMHAVWFLAEWFRTGGGIPGKHYNDGDPAREDPIRAYFWFSVMAGQKQFYQNVDEDSVRLGKIGRTAVGAQLFESEKEEIVEAVADWKPGGDSVEPERCLDVPSGIEVENER